MWRKSLILFYDIDERNGDHVLWWYKINDKIRVVIIAGILERFNKTNLLRNFYWLPFNSFEKWFRKQDWRVQFIGSTINF